MEGIKRYRSNKLFSEVVVYNGVAYVSGQVDYRQSRTCAAQTAEILQLMDRLLEEAGTNKENLLQAIVYLASPSDFEEMNIEWNKWIVPGHEPARTVVGSQFSNPGWLIKISLVAAVPK